MPIYNWVSDFGTMMQFEKERIILFNIHQRDTFSFFLSNSDFFVFDHSDTVYLKFIQKEDNLTLSLEEGLHRSLLIRIKQFFPGTNTLLFKRINEKTKWDSLEIRRFYFDPMAWKRMGMAEYLFVNNKNEVRIQSVYRMPERSKVYCCKLDSTKWKGIQSELNLVNPFTFELLDREEIEDRFMEEEITLYLPDSVYTFTGYQVPKSFYFLHSFLLLDGVINCK
jgi:hypothetical protein